jgi:putative Mn2+ efflux pump MntP
MDAFTGLYLNGFIRETRLSYGLYAGSVISLFNTLAALLGKLIGSQINILLESFSLPLAIGVLFIIGIKMAIKSFKPKFQEMTYELHKKKILSVYAFALSMNAFLLGLALSAFNISWGIFSLVLLVVFFALPLFGMLLSRKSTKFLLAARLEFLGGIVLIGGSIFYMIKFFELY